MFGNTYPPKSEDATIDIYMTNKPTQEYVEFRFVAWLARTIIPKLIVFWVFGAISS